MISDCCATLDNCMVPCNQVSPIRRIRIEYAMTSDQCINTNHCFRILIVIYILIVSSQWFPDNAIVTNDAVISDSYIIINRSIVSNLYILAEMCFWADEYIPFIKLHFEFRFLNSV